MRTAPGARLYGRRKGKRLAAYQHRLMETLLPRLAMDVSNPVDPADLFAGSRETGITGAPTDTRLNTCSDIWLEIGFGAGEHMLATAARHPEVGLIGCEPFVNGVARALADLAGADLGNIRLHCGDAGDVIAALPAACLGRVFLFYPDPWPKRHQRKRRFVSDAMLQQLARVMRPGAELRFATDIDDYCGWTLARLQRSSSFAWSAAAASDWQAPWPHWIPTRYEAKAIVAGRRPCYLTAVRC